MTPGQASAEGRTLRIDYDGNTVYAAHVFDTRDGLVFVRHGWTHPYASAKMAGSLKGTPAPYDLETWRIAMEDGSTGWVAMEDGYEPPDGDRRAAFQAITDYYDSERITDTTPA